MRSHLPLTSDEPAKALDDEYVTVMFQAKNMCAAQAAPSGQKCTAEMWSAKSDTK